MPRLIKRVIEGGVKKFKSLELSLRILPCVEGRKVRLVDDSGPMSKQPTHLGCPARTRLIEEPTVEESTQPGRSVTLLVADPGTWRRRFVIGGQVHTYISRIG